MPNGRVAQQNTCMKGASIGARKIKFINRLYMKNQRLIWIAILVIIIFVCIVYSTASAEGFEGRSAQKQLKYVNLVLYSEDKDYNQMKEITEKYYKKFENVTTIYYKFDKDMVEKHRMDGNVLKIKGTESYLPGILDKTVKAMEYVLEKNYGCDYLVRSNISTIVDFELLDKELRKNPIEYGGGLINELQMIDKSGGIVDDTYFGLKYASGTAIVFSKKTLEQVMAKRDKINYKVIDDVAIGLLMRDEFNKPAEQVGSFLIVSDGSEISKKPYVFYRNRSSNRATDVKNMKRIIESR
jgi:hypothetical protein